MVNATFEIFRHSISDNILSHFLQSNIPSSKITSDLYFLDNIWVLKFSSQQTRLFLLSYFVEDLIHRVSAERNFL